MFWSLIMSPPTIAGWGGHIVFGTDPVGIGVGVRVSVSVSIKLLVHSVTWIPFGIFWWYLVEMKIRTRWRVTYKIDNTGCLTFGITTLCFCFFFWKRFHVRSVIRIPLWNISMVLGRNVEQDQTTFYIQEWQLWLSYFWSYIPLFCLK